MARNAIARTVSRSTWLRTSSTSASVRSQSTSRPVLIGGSGAAANRTSTTAPRTDKTVSPTKLERTACDDAPSAATRR